MPLFLTGLCWCLVVAVQARREEAELLARFGEEYRAYQRRTGRFLPPLG
ncbi:MAG: hypothetical protein KatS3mg115_1684 [Candidatus Poribacteria bacterium]|nr:MAG: hypothetical protein KatS3mg115_1684 [Candidatus Poribacteria bacterium]